VTGGNGPNQTRRNVRTIKAFEDEGRSIKKVEDFKDAAEQPLRNISVYEPATTKPAFTNI
jgi:hypothetical protein